MARIIGVEIPNDKKIGIALRYIYGIGPTLALEVCEKAQVSPDIRTKDLTDEQLSHLTTALQGYRIEGDLRREVQQNIKRKMSINCYQGIRHKRGLPVRGQRTSTNARTRKGPRKTVGVQRSKEAKAAAKEKQ
ncbi:MAG: 30S ribosomal protein S13 [Verrucomicrobiae bacterium]|nr:30S ribosomal protein S13 [Verrucomicrobiae bacterium]MDW8344549.1 30S ribosomal protein S13 [Verrucomicrobiae bacterium]